eukprot:TRINITY_DN3696_c0_g1_i1.p1 TRINITY_DN3696_c0_g1~~TRINITY_DN3696_c0_g1_i1.p1  ORF type:complete len:683 (+),score=159.13 TRINITY_DN3696_c0_g1_i1:191-2239(+)
MMSSGSKRSARRDSSKITECTLAQNTQLVRAQCKHVVTAVDGVYAPYELAEWESLAGEHFVYQPDIVDQGVNDPPPPASDASLREFEKRRQAPGLQGVIDKGRGDINSLVESLNQDERFRRMEAISGWFSGFSAKAAQEIAQLRQLDQDLDAKENDANISHDRAMKAEQASNARTGKIVNFVEAMQGTVGSGGGMALGAIAQRRHQLAHDNFVKTRDITLQAKIQNQEQIDELAKLRHAFRAKIVENKDNEDEDHRLRDLEREVEMIKAEISKLSAEVEAKQSHAAELKRLTEGIRKSAEEESCFELDSQHPLAKTLNKAKQHAKTNQTLIHTLCPGIVEAEKKAQQEALAASKLKHQAEDLEKLIESREEVLGIIHGHNHGDEHELSDPDEPDENADESDLEYIPDEDLRQELTQTVTKLREHRKQLDSLVKEKQAMSAALLRCWDLREATRRHLMHLAACIAADEAEVQQDRPLPASAERWLPSRWRQELDRNLEHSRHIAEMYATLMLACSQGTCALTIDAESDSSSVLHEYNGISFLNAQRVKLCSHDDRATDSLEKILLDAESHWTRLLNLESSLTPACHNPEKVERLQNLLINADCNHLWRDEDQNARMRLSIINREQQKLMTEANLALLKLSRESRIDQVAQVASGVVGSRPAASLPSARGATRKSQLKVQQTLR